MAYIQPNSTVEFFGDIGLSPNYENSLYFASENARDTYFSSLTKIATVSSVTYIREKRGFIRVERPMSTMYNVGYMRYRNTSFENKWFYAFVKSVNYINNTTTEIEFDIDYFMTWMGVFTLKQCFIERQHTVTDVIGDNLVDENLDYGEYIIENSTVTGYFNDDDEYMTLVLTTLNNDGTGVNTTLTKYEGVYAGATPHVFLTDTQAGRDALETFFNNVATNNFEDGVVSVYQVPRLFLSNAHAPLICTPIGKPYTTINGYTPKNNKLFIYPYNVLEVSNMEGLFTDYRYEFFSTPDYVNFEIIYNFLPPVQAVLYPKNYKGLVSNYNEGCVMASFPISSYVADSYKAYLAQTQSDAIVKGVESVASGAVTGGLLGGLIGAGIGAIRGVATGVMAALHPEIERISNQITGRSERASRPNIERGKAVVNTFYANDQKDFRFNRKQITAEYAETIDNFFTMFGYAVKKIGTPNMNARPYFTYVKTIGCSIEGNLPADDASKIENIFDNGIRLWKNHNNIGDYSLNNAPVTQT